MRCLRFLNRGPVLLLAGLLLLGCRGDRAATVVEFWVMGREGEVVQQLLPAFEQQHPGIRVRVQQIPWSAAHEKLLTAYAGDAMPDVFQLGNTWIPEFVALRAVAPLDDRLAASATRVADDIFPGILATHLMDGRIWGMPWYVDTRLLFYRTDILNAAGFTAPPHSWNAWVEVMTRIKDQAGADRYALLIPLTEWQLPVILALQRGAELLREGDRYGNFRSAPVRDAFAFYLELFQRRLAPPVGETQVGNLYQEFAAGYFALYVSGPWNIGEFTRRLPVALQDRWTTAPLPGPGTDYPGVSLAGGASLALSRTSPRQAEAWKLLEYLSAPEQQIEFYRLTGDLPARMSAWRDAALADNPRTQAFWQQLQQLRTTPKIPEWEQIAAQIARYLEEAIRGRMSLEEALVALDHDVDRLLEKRRWLLERKR